MKNFLFLTIFFVFYSNIVLADAWTKKRNTCAFGWKYFNAYAEVDEANGSDCFVVFVPTGTEMVWDPFLENWIIQDTGFEQIVCETNWECRDYEHKKRCYSPTSEAIAEWSKTVGGVLRKGKAKAKHGEGLQITEEYTNHASIRAGSAECIELCPNSDFNDIPLGFSYSSLQIAANFQNNKIVCSGLKGKIAVSESGDYESIYKIILIKDDKEDDICTNDPNDPDLCYGQKTILDFSNMQIAYETSITVSKNGIMGKGELAQLAGQFKKISFEVDGRTEQGVGIEFNNLSFSFDIPQQESTNNWTILCYVDGGYNQEKLTKLLNRNCKSEPKNNDADNKINLFPNPVSDIATVTLNKDMIAKERGILSIYDINGNLMERTNTSKYNSSISINTQKYNSGVYFLTYESKTQKLSHKFIVK